MISYNWTHKEIVLRLNKYLKTAGYRTWIDVEQMTGSTLEAMAQAIEQASAVVCCFSDRYKESPNCRAEAEYAFRLQKPIVPVRVQPQYKPDGWLGMLLGTKLYFNCFALDAVEGSGEKVLHELGRILTPPSPPSTTSTVLSTTVTPTTVTPTNPSNVASLPPISSSPTPPRSKEKSVKRSVSSESGKNEVKLKRTKSKDIQLWPQKKVEEWIKSNKLQHLTKNFNGFDGVLLSRLFTLYEDKPTLFLDMLKGMQITQPTDSLKFIDALEKLFAG